MNISLLGLTVVAVLTATSAAAQNTFPAGGNVGIGTTTPIALLDVNGTGGLAVSGADLDPRGGYSLIALQNTGQLLEGWNQSGGAGEIDLISNRGPGGSGGFSFFDYSNSGVLTPLLTLEGTGTMDVGGTGTLNFLNGMVGAKLAFPDGTVQTTAYQGGISSVNGNLGVGTSSPSATLSVASGGLGATAGNTLSLFNIQSTNANVSWLNITQIRNANGSDWTTATTRIQQVTDVTPQGYIDFNPAGAPYALAFGSHDGEVMRLFDSGNVAIGTTAAGAKLEVNGGIKLSTGSGGSISFPDSSVQSTAWNGTLAGADYAESVDVSGDRSKYEPGDVLVIVSGAVRIFRRADSPYSKLVAGVYSTKPGVLGKRETINATQLGEEVPMAMVGIVPTKVSAENGPIEAGDLLVTSSLEGYAMKGTDQTKMLGAIIGKALGALDTGTGMIEVLVTLQ